jgi:hypothetical protein
MFQKFIKMNKLVLIIGWQLVVFVLSAGGVFGAIYELLGIPWNSTGWINVLGTVVVFILLEIPAIIVMVWLLRARKLT